MEQHRHMILHKIVIPVLYCTRKLDSIYIYLLELVQHSLRVTKKQSNLLMS